jgi:hypothetical protein
MTRSRSCLLAAAVCCFAFFGVHPAPLAAQDFSTAVVFYDAGFPAADSAGARLTLTLKSQHAALALIDKQSKSVIAKYGF